ncbi:helix-turn-helix transcriptional regulator [Rhodospirillum rubrum]|nr:LuxR family transcriptional regulator [Rhodospirillum rubrum]
MNKDCSLTVAQCGFQTRLAACDTPRSCWSLMRREFEAAGVPHVSYGALFSPHYRSDPGRETVYMSHFDQAFLDRYSQAGHLSHDTAVQWVFRFSQPVPWVTPRRLAELSERQIRVWEEGEAFGVRNGLSVPVRFGRDGSAGGLFFSATGLGDDDWRGILTDKGATLVALAYTFHEAMERFPLFSTRVNPQDHVIHLTNRERESLIWSARGCQVGEVADRLGVADRTAEHHLGAARRKLMARTTAQAVARALAMGLLFDGVAPLRRAPGDLPFPDPGADLQSVSI